MSERITTFRSTEELAALRDTWRDLGPRDVNADPDLLLALVELRADVLRPHVVLAETNGSRAMLVARLERTRLPVRLGYLQLYAPRVRALTVVQGGALGQLGERALSAAFTEASRALEDGEADVLRLRGARVGSEIHTLATERHSRATRGRASRPSRRWRLTLPESLEAVLRLQSSRTRANHRRYVRKLDDEFGDRLSFRVHRDPAELAQVVRDCEAVSAKTYQRALGAGFDPAERRLLEIGAENGWLRAYVLSIDDEPRAFWLGNAYSRVFYTGPTGYDPALATYRLGTYVLMHMLEDLCADPDVDEVDYGQGDAEYKRHFGTHSWLEEDVLVFAPTFRGVRINLTRTALMRTADVARRVAEHAPAFRDVKRKWRKLLVSEPRKARRPVPRIVLVSLLLALVLPAMLLGSVAAAAVLDRPATTMHDEMIVNAPRPLVWKLLTEFEGYDNWNPYITEADGSARKGTEIDLRIEPHGESAANVECDVVTVKHLRKLYWRCRDHSMPGLLDREHVFRLLPVDPDGEQVRLVYDGRWEGVLVPFTELGNRKAGYLRMLSALKQHAELSS
ncbi:MAG: GNAT family N-acetyltransferase [Gaiellaceae bacterium]